MTKYPLTYSGEIELLPVEFTSIDKLNVEEQNLGPYSENLLLMSIRNWEIALGRKLNYVLRLVGREEETKIVEFNIDGLLNEFAGLKSKKEIEHFSIKYGLLGIEHPSTEQLDSSFPVLKALLTPEFLFTNYGFSALEPIELWEWHIQLVRRILKLYHAIEKGKPEEYINDIIEIKLDSGHFGTYVDDTKIYERYFVYWTNGEKILMLPSDYEEKSMLEIAIYTLSQVLQNCISGGINLETGDIVFNPSTKGFRVNEERSTNYLIAAIYYELWQVINDSKNVFICANKNCRLPFVKSGRKKYCNEACKQEAYRLRIKDMERGEL
ncbi:hypothetical protein [Bacillus altitudinis]|uniref:hypothetical protein n=1 Tax=Bacillus altitudinis TaxID=293387 RepID=UPI003CF107A2